MSCQAEYTFESSFDTHTMATYTPLLGGGGTLCLCCHLQAVQLQRQKFVCMRSDIFVILLYHNLFNTF